jgi:cobalt-zinc-cadmium efflux system outer membrane protein
MHFQLSPRMCWRSWALAACLCWLAAPACYGQAPAVPPPGEVLPTVLTRDEAVRWALQHNPELASIRQQHGIAAAAVVIAETYPFNPAWEGIVEGNTGPRSAGITNSVSQEHRVSIDMEIHHQGRYRRQGAYAALTRTDWEIAFQEQSMAIRAVRAFNAVVYRQRKLELLEETVRLSDQTLQQATALFGAQRLPRADVIVAQSDVDDARAALGTGRTTLVAAQYDLRRVLGLVNEPFDIRGSLDLPAIDWNVEALMRGALEQRADLRARQAGVTEAQARLDLEIRNRWGNPNIGPIYAIDPTQVSSTGVAFILPIPVVNRHRGEIQQREAERARAGLDLRQIEVTVQQDVAAALRHLREARAWQQTYEKEVLPHLQGSLKEIQTLLENAVVDVLRVSAVRRNLIRARDGYLDALFEVNQAQADLAAAVGDPALALNPGTPRP